MLARVADSIYWMSRYVERAENVARFIEVNLNLMLDLPAGAAQQWQPLVATTGDSEEFAKRYDTATQQNVIQFLTFDEENVNSIRSCLRLARENARSVREIISSEMWENLNEFYLRVNSAEAGSRTDPQDVLRSIKRSGHLFTGVTDATMTHNESWHFCQLGCMLERADKTSRILDVKYFLLLPTAADVGTTSDDIQWAAVLRSASAFEMYRKSHGRIAPERVVEFLLFETGVPARNPVLSPAGAHVGARHLWDAGRDVPVSARTYVRRALLRARVRARRNHHRGRAARVPRSPADEDQRDRLAGFRNVLRGAGHPRPQEGERTKGCDAVRLNALRDDVLFDDAHLDVHIAESRSRTVERPVQRHGVPMVPRHGDSNEIAIADNAVGGIEVDPPGSRQVRLHPGVRVPATNGSGSTLRHEDVTADEARSEADQANGVHHEHGEVPAAPAAASKRLGWRLDAFLRAPQIRELFLDAARH